MSKAEKFIKDCTRNCSNELIAVESRANKEVISYHEWLTPDQARKAVEIAKEETLLEVAAWIKNKAENYIVDTPLCSYFDYKRAVEDFKQVIR